MKKKYIIIALGILGFLFLLSQIGFQVGSFRIGKQVDLEVPQNKNFEESLFFKEYFSKESTIVLNIWATWCKPCLEEIPTLHEVQRNFKKGDVQYLSLSIDKDSVALSKFLDSKHFNYKDITFENLAFRKSILNTLEGKNPDKHILTQTVPITYVIKNRKVIRKFEGGIEKERLENSLNEI